MKHFVTYLVEEYEKQNRVDDFVKFAAEYLHLNIPQVTLLTDRDENMTTASYNIRTGEIRVYIKGRACFDICRSIAHEMVHAMQHEHEGPHRLDGSTGSPHEDEANAVAGRIIRSYGKQNPDFYNES
jgi:hypothetical protein